MFTIFPFYYFTKKMLSNLLIILQALEEIKDFMIIKGLATKERQKLMRNLRVSYPVWNP